MKSNLLIATLITILLTAWMVIGSVFAQQKAEEKAAQNVPAEKKLPAVRFRDAQAESFAAEITLRGKTEPAKSSILRAEVSAPVLSIEAERGSWVKAGQVLIKLDPKTLPSQYEAAEAILKQREMEASAALKLQSNGYQSETRLAEADAQFAEARSQADSIRIALENTEIKAPYDGIFNDRLVQRGDFVSVGDPVASFLQLDPLIIVAHATESEVARLETGKPATVLLNGQQIEGKIRFVSRAGDEIMRTYRVEIEFPNDGRNLRAGQTASVRYTTDSVMAHKVSPALLFTSANTEGELGIKTLDENDVVEFHKATIIASANDGVWISGLPEHARIITVGQGYVKPGSKVSPIEESTIQ